jgi:hypothetical protein
MTCPCCKSADIGGQPEVALLCWDCYAKFHEALGGIIVDDCMCGRHDDGKLLRGSPDEK